ncbi:MAG: rhomboid family intramembrane serine protease [Terracidiphilus sp.]
MGSYSPDPGPQVLPPDEGYIPPPARRPRPMWQVSPATYILVGINCAVFLYMVASHVSPISPTPEQLIHFGADHAGYVLRGGDWWRIVTAMFVHVGIIHLATNMWCLWNLGLLAEPLMGSAGLLAAYILTGAAGNLLSTMMNWFYPLADGAGGVAYPVGAGASGAVFGIAGVLIVLLKSPLLPVPPLELKKLRKSVITFAAINLVIGFASMAPGVGVHIDNMAHLGGFSCGLLFAVPLVPRLGAPRRQFLVRRRVAVVAVAALLTLFAFYLDQLPG